MKEEWKKLDCANNYEISNLGRVRNVKRKNVLKPSTTKDGYSIVNLSINGVIKCFSVHRLIALAFIEKPNGKDYVDHINGDTKDNSISNLRWVTNKENVNTELCIKHKRIAQTNRWKCGIDQYTEKMEFVRHYPSVMEAVRQTGITYGSIYGCASGRYKHGGHYIWIFNKE